MRKIISLLLLFLFFSSCTKTSINSVFNDPEVYKWKNISQDLINSCDTVEIYDLHTAAYLMYSNGSINGWENELTVKYYLRSLEILEESSYGLQYEWDAFQDGTLNSDTTNYTITMTDHLGLSFIEGYKNKLVNDDELLNIFEKLLLIPKADTIQDGICFSYSDSPNDQVGCVHNVNISVAYFISEILNLNLIDKSYQSIVDSIIIRENNAYLPEQINYLYWDGSDRLTDHNHLCFQAWCMYNLSNNESNKIALNIIDNISLNREKTISSLIGYLRVLPINDFDADSLYNDLETIINKSDTIYISDNSYFIDNTRIKSQLALWSAIYYRHLINKAINS